MRLNPIADRLTPFCYDGTGYGTRLDANENCVALLPPVQEDLNRAVAALDWNRYPDDTTETLRRTYAAAFSLDAAGVLPGNGSDELINIAVGRLTPPDGVILGIERDFGSYWFAAELFGRRVVQLPRAADLTFTADALIEGARLHRADLIIFSNPNNPSGSQLGRAEVLRLVEAVDCLVVVDEAYMDFSDQSVLDCAGKYPNLLVLRTLSKAMGMAGARIGFAVTTPALARKMRALQDAFSLSAVDQLAGTVLLRHPEQLAHNIAETRRLMAILTSGLERLAQKAPIRVYPSVANFVLVGMADAKAVWEALHRQDISVRRLGDDWLRISLAPEPVLRRVLAALEQALDEIGGGAR